MTKAYLTIDDSPSPQTTLLTSWLAAQNIPALLFCRGDRMEENPEAVIDAIKKGFVIGNHAYSHTRFSELSLEEGIAEIEKTDKMIDQAYEAAGVKRPGKYFRFPHMDRGMGGYVVDYDKAGAHKETLIKLFSEGLNISLKKPSQEQREKEAALQNYLKEQGFEAPSFSRIAFDWYKSTALAETVDTMFTYSTSDWMVTPRHAGKWPWKNLEDLKKKIDQDLHLKDQNSAHIILMHDQPDMLKITKPLIEHMKAKGFHFSSFQPPAPTPQAKPGL